MIRLSGLQARELTGLPLSFLAHRRDLGLKPFFAVEETETQKGFYSRSHNTGVAAGACDTRKTRVSIGAASISARPAP